MFYKEKTSRSFVLLKFKDDYDVDCSLQESSLVEPHIWLGVHKADPQIMCQDAISLGIPTKDTVGWQKYEVPEQVFINTRMHLNRKQAKQLARKLSYFARTGKIK